MTERWKVTVSGRVHDVGLRAIIARQARILGLVGWVTNIPAGVILEVEGEANQLLSFKDWLEQSPGWSKIEKFTQQNIPTVRETEFIIKY
ncbi:MAG: acylphosphatase [Patescibacteria group bacterium]